MATLAENIKKYRKANNFTQKSLAEELGIAPTAVSAWELGRNKPLMDNIEQMASLFKIKKSQLLGDDLPIESPQVEVIPSTLQKITATSSRLEHKRQLVVLDTAQTQLKEQTAEQNSVDIVADNVVQIPKLYTYNYYDHPASAGTGQYLNDVQIEQIELPVDCNADFVVPIYGDSMEPDYSSGDYVFIKLSVDLLDGEIGVFEYNSDAYIKQLVIEDDKAYLHSLNDAYPDMPIDKDTNFRIFGKVVGKYSEK